MWAAPPCWWFESIEEMRQDAFGRPTHSGESSDLLFTRWNDNDNEDDSFVFDYIPLANQHALERITTAFTDAQHVRVYEGAGEARAR